LAELTVWLFVTALNCSDTENSNQFKVTQRGLKRQSEWEELCLQGIKQPSLKKLAALEEDLGIMVSVPTNCESKLKLKLKASFILNRFDQMKNQNHCIKPLPN
jgi:hypothetical protein